MIEIILYILIGYGAIIGTFVLVAEVEDHKEDSRIKHKRVMHKLSKMKELT